MLSTVYYHIRHNHPIWYFITLFTAGMILIVNIFAFTATNTSLLDTVGATSLKNRIVAGKEYLFWSYRAWKHNGGQVPVQPAKYFGFMQSVNRNGTVNVTVIDKSQYQVMQVALADIIVLNPDGLAAIVDLHKHDDAEIDVYPNKNTSMYSVIWLGGKPFNVQIITSGVAMPDTNPPTNIVDRAFAEYYWKQLTQ